LFGTACRDSILARHVMYCAEAYRALPPGASDEAKEKYQSQNPHIKIANHYLSKIESSFQFFTSRLTTKT
jgi:hypothetical protein